MREIGAELKALKLYGMASAWSELSTKGKDVGIDSSRWLIEQLLDAESADRAMRSIRWQMSSARFPIHRDLAGFNFEQSCGSQADQRALGVQFHRRCTQRRFGRWTRYWEIALGHCAGHLRHHSARTAGAFLLYCGPGQRAGAGGERR
jgi:IstB-like ATP binding protein